VLNPLITKEAHHHSTHKHPNVNIIISGSSVWRRFPVPISRRAEKSDRVDRQWSESAADAKQVDKIKIMMILMLLVIMMILMLLMIMMILMLPMIMMIIMLLMI